MTNGILIFAHNNREVDYGLLAVISGGLAKKHLHVPVSLVTDHSTKEWLIESPIITSDSMFQYLLRLSLKIKKSLSISSVLS